MGKTNSLLLAFALLGSSVGAWAQTDVTDKITNPNITEQTAKDKVPSGWSAGPRATGNTNYTESTGDTQLEAWSGGYMYFDYYQDISVDNGIYTVSAKCHDTNGAGGYLYASSGGQVVKTSMTTGYSVITTDRIYVHDGKIRLGIKKDMLPNTGGSWITGDDFKLSKYDESLEEYVATYNILVDYATSYCQKALSKSTRTALENAIVANVDLTSTESISSAINTIKSALASAAEFVETTSTSLACQANTGWTNTPTLNTWSTEGDAYGKDMKVPFLQTWIASGSTVANNSYEYTLSDLASGTYDVSVLARAMRESGTSGVTLSGATLTANGNEVSLTTGDACTNGVYGRYTTTATVSDDGSLKLAINIASANFNWLAWKDIQVTYHSTIAAKAAFNEAKTQATEAISNDLYKNVIGKEKVDLNAVIGKYTSTPDDLTTLTTATTELNEATTAFTAAKDAYDALVAENTKAEAFGITAVSITETTTAASAVTSMQELMVKEYKAVKDEYTSSVKLGDWTTTGPVGEMKSQHWDGTATSSYYEQSSAAYKQSSWDITYTQDVTLPKGDYVFKMTGRHGSNSGTLSNTMELTVKSGTSVIGTVNDFPVGDTGLGVNKDGATSFDASDATGFANSGKGRGWQWRYVPFTLSEETTVTFTIHAAATAVNQWCSFCNYTVEAKPSVEASTIVYNQAVEAASTAKTNYPDTKGKELAELNAALAADKGTTVETIDAATATIKEKTEAYIAANDSWKRYSYATQAATKASVSYTDISSDNTKTASDALTEANTIFVSALTNAHTQVNGYTLGFEKDEYAPYNLVAVESVLANLIVDNAVSADKVAEADGKDLLAAVTDAYSCVANTKEINAIYDGTLKNAPIQATTENVVLPGWYTVKGNTRQTFQGSDSKACLAGADDQTGLFVHTGTYQYGNTAGYTMPLKAGYYRVSVKYCSWEGTSNNGLGLTILKKDGDAVATKNFGANSTNVSNSSAFKKAVMDFEVKEAGNYVLSIYANGNTFMTDFYILKATATDLTLDEAATYTPEAAYANVTLKRTLVQGWNGLVLPFDMTVEDAKTTFGASDVKAFSGISVDATKGTTLKFEDATSIEAGVPVMIKVTDTPASSEYKIDNVFLPGTDLAPQSYTESDVTYSFQGTYANTNLAGKTFALIQGSHIYNYDGTETSVNAKTFRAYFLNETPEASESKLYGFDLGDIETGITEVKRNANGNADKMFDLQGRSVKNAAKGLYIKNGKKVIVK